MKSLITLTLLVCWATYAQAELKFVQVVFRHGDRAPDSDGFEKFPKDPYRDATFDPYLRGGLTNEGKMREYALGVYLRRLYGEFLGDTYYAKEVKARSTDTDHTKMSLQLVLAGLYPPNYKQRWNPALDWQPISTSHVPSLDDNLMVPEECPLYLLAREKAEQSNEFQAKLKSFEPFMRNLSEATGLSVKNTNQIYFLYHTLAAQQALGLRLPEWVTEDIFPRGKLLDAIKLEYEIFSFNTEMRRLNGGMFIRRFTDDMILANRTEESKRKINIYSGHDTNVVAVLQALGVYKPHVPAYSSAVFIELHKEHNEYYVKAKYYKGIPAQHEELNIPGCGYKCTLEQFRRATLDVYPMELETICNKRALLESVASYRIRIPPGIMDQVFKIIDSEKRAKYLQFIHQ